MMEKLEKQALLELATSTTPLTERTTQVTRRTTTQIARKPEKKPTKKFRPSTNYELEDPEPRLKHYKGPCNCTRIIMTSNNPTTISKHGSELGQYNLIGGLGGRPVYRHIHRSFYLFYQAESGGNWLVNTRPGLTFGGIQNSKVHKNLCLPLVYCDWQVL